MDLQPYNIAFFRVYLASSTLIIFLVTQRLQIMTILTIKYFYHLIYTETKH
jgi:hypothetical protein